MSLSREQQKSFLILYREVQSDDGLEADLITEDDEVGSINELLDDVRGRIEDHHELDSLDVSSFFEDWITDVLANSGSLDSESESEIGRELEYLAENFSDSMLSRARERGKYVVLIVSEGSLIVCHSFTGKKALTTDMDVIEELLSESNIDKFAEFQYNDDRDIIVHHFDRNDTQSFTNWLGIPEDEIAFDVKGDVRIYTKIDEIDVVFEFDQDAITSKLLASDDYDLVDGMLKTPNEPARRVDRVQWGYDTFSNVEEFKQELFKVNHNLIRAFDLYDNEISDSLDSFFDVQDRPNRIVKETGDSTQEIKKPKVDFEIVYVNKQVDMDVSWRNELAQKLFANHDPVPICHAGGEFSEDAFNIGNFRIYNEIGLSEIQQGYIDDLLSTAKDLGTANLRPLFTHIAFELLFQTNPKPVRYLFKEFSDKFRTQFLESNGDGTRVIQTEGEDIDLEYKSPPWFDRQSSTDELAQGIHREFQNSRLLILGINEDAKDIDVIESGVKSEELIEVEDCLEDEFRVEEAHIWSLPIGEGHGIIALNVDSPVNTFKGNVAFLEATE